MLQNISELLIMLLALFLLLRIYTISMKYWMKIFKIEYFKIANNNDRKIIFTIFNFELS